MANKLEIANQLLLLSTQIESRLADSDIAYAIEHESERMALAREIFSSKVDDKDQPQLQAIICEVLEINSRLQVFANKTKDEISKLCRQNKQARKATNAYKNNSFL